MPPSINMLACLRMTGRPAQSVAARTFISPSPLRQTRALSTHPAAARRSSLFNSTALLPRLSQQQRWSSTDKDPELEKFNEEIENTPEDKLAGHNFPHPKVLKSRSPEEEQGSPVEEFFKRDEDALKYAPKVLRDKIKPKPPGSGSGSRSYSTAATPPPAGAEATPMEQLIAAMGSGSAPLDGMPEGLKFGMPPKPDYATGHLRKRYDPVLDQFTKMLMRHGKLAKAESNMNTIIDILRCSSPPKLDSDRRLVYNLAPEEYPLNPVLYLTNVVDSIAPLLRIKQMKGAAGGGMSLPVPRPLASRQRRRMAIKWIIEASEKRRDISLSKRVAEEIIAVAEGRSSTWMKRDMVHKLGIMARTNMSLGPRR